MADPVIVGGIRAIVELSKTGGGDEDVYVNTWCFANATPGPVTETSLVDAADALDLFYTNLQMRLGSQVGDIRAKLYDLGQTPPRDPTEFVLVAPSTTANSLPSELCVAMSFYAATNRPKHRGRIYFGPLRADTIDSSGDFPRPALALRTALTGAGAALIDTATTVRWGVLSGVDGVIRQVTNGWVDNAFDIQRRRGEDPTDRQLFA